MDLRERRLLNTPFQWSLNEFFPRFFDFFMFLSSSIDSLTHQCFSIAVAMCFLVFFFKSNDDYSLSNGYFVVLFIFNRPRNRHLKCITDCRSVFFFVANLYCTFVAPIIRLNISSLDKRYICLWFSFTYTHTRSMFGCFRMNEWCYNLFNCPLSIELVVKVTFGSNLPSPKGLTTIKSSYFTVYTTEHTWIFIVYILGIVLLSICYVLVFFYMLVFFICLFYFLLVRLLYLHHLQLFRTNCSIFHGQAKDTYITQNQSTRRQKKNYALSKMHIFSLLFGHLNCMRVCTQMSIDLNRTKKKKQNRNK